MKTLLLLLTAALFTGCAAGTRITPGEVRDWSKAGRAVLRDGVQDYKELKPLFSLAPAPPVIGTTILDAADFVAIKLEADFYRDQGIADYRGISVYEYRRGLSTEHCALTTSALSP